MKPEPNRITIKSAISNKLFGFFNRGKSGILDSGQLIESAIKKTGFSDFGDLYFEEGLERLVEEANHDTNLNHLGRFLIKSALIHNLSNRLLFCHEMKTGSQMEKTELIPPIIITGLPRSGTTLLHRLLIQDEGHQGTPLWEMLRPVNEPGKKDRRRLKARLEMKASNFFKGNLNHIHYAAYQEPEECVYLFGTTFNALLYWIQFPFFDYIDWYIDQDRDKKYRDYYHYLKILQAGHPGKRLVMKSPEHLGSIQEIKQNIPGVILIETHRDPVECYNSMNSLLYNIHKSVAHYSDKAKLTGANMKLLENELARNRKARKNMADGIIDVWYEDLISDPIGVAESIYRLAGINMNGATRQSMEQYVRDNPKNKFGAHQYDSRAFGLSDEMTREKFRGLEITR